MNLTLAVPQGSTNHGNPNLLCIPAKWYDIIFFFLANYLAHAASVIIEPGQSLSYSGLCVLVGLLLPGSGVIRAVVAIFRHAATETKDPLKRAARASALCMVLKRPKYGRYSLDSDGLRATDTELGQLMSTTEVANQEPDEVLPCVNEERPEIQANSDSQRPNEVSSSSPPSGSHWWDPPNVYRRVPPGTDIHGQYWLKKNSHYYLAMVPPGASMRLDVDQDRVVNRGQETAPNLILGSSSSLLKLAVGLLQSVWAIITLYRTRGDQIQQYGYAAFGLTVAPYATMSILNSVASLLTSVYPSMFLIRTPAMDKVERDGEGFFKGAIRVQLQDTSPAQGMWKRLGRSPLPADVDPAALFLFEERPILIMGISIICSLIPLAIVGGLSGFRQGGSSHLERGFTMSWLVVGIFYGVMSGLADLMDVLYPLGVRMRAWTVGLYIGIFCTFGVPAIGGMVVVGMMIRSFGICTLIG